MRVAKLVCLLLLSAVPASADPLLDLGSRDCLARWLGSDATLTLSAEKPALVTNEFWLALEGKGPSLVVVEAIVGGTSFLIGAYSPISFDRNLVEFASDGRELDAGHHYTFENSDREAFLFNLSSGSMLRQKPSTDPSQVWFIDSGFGIEFGLGDLGILGRQLSFGTATATNFGTANGRNLFGEQGTTSFGIGRIEVYSVERVPEPASLLLMAAAVPVYAALRRRRRK